MFKEQFRAAKGLSEVYNRLFYNGLIVDAEGTMNRGKALRAISWIKRQFGLYDGIPHIFLNVQNGETLQDPKISSKYNPANVVTAVHQISAILDEGVWTADQITVITPYREQAARYRKVLKQMGLREVKISTEVFTVDLAQGRENQCTIYDLVLAHTRVGGTKFVRDSQRLNVAISRSQNMSILVNDLNSLAPNDRELQHRQSLTDEGRALREAQEADNARNLRFVFDYYVEKNMVQDIDPQTFEEVKYIDLEPATKHKGSDKTCYNCGQPGHFTCYNCGEIGHSSSQCTNEKVEYCKVCLGYGHVPRYCPDSVCKKCNESGHQAQDCPKRKCGGCHELGHNKAECPKRKEAVWTVPGTTFEDDDVEESKGKGKSKEKKVSDIFGDLDPSWQVSQAENKQSIEAQDADNASAPNIDDASALSTGDDPNLDIGNDPNFDTDDASGPNIDDASALSTGGDPHLDTDNTSAFKIGDVPIHHRHEAQVQDRGDLAPVGDDDDQSQGADEISTDGFNGYEPEEDLWVVDTHVVVRLPSSQLSPPTPDNPGGSTNLANESLREWNPAVYENSGCHMW